MKIDLQGKCTMMRYLKDPHGPPKLTQRMRRAHYTATVDMYVFGDLHEDFTSLVREVQRHLKSAH